jgi:hypothetical protein
VIKVFTFLWGFKGFTFIKGETFFRTAKGFTFLYVKEKPFPDHQNSPFRSNQLSSTFAKYSRIKNKQELWIINLV